MGEKAMRLEGDEAKGDEAKGDEAKGEINIPAGAKKELAKLFQALRIEVNDEMGALREMLIAAKDLLKPGGRIAILTYHSLEDRIVKNFLRSGNLDGTIEKTDMRLGISVKKRRYINLMGLHQLAQFISRRHYDTMMRKTHDKLPKKS